MIPVFKLYSISLGGSKIRFWRKVYSEKKRKCAYNDTSRVLRRAIDLNHRVEAANQRRIRVGR